MAVNQLQVIDGPTRQPLVSSVAVTPEQALFSYKALQEITKKVLVDGSDYGIIPGTPKPTLYKAGAENLLRFYGLGHRVHMIEELKDWEKGFFYFSYKVSVHKTMENGVEFVLSECEGSANSKEKKYAKQEPFSIVNTLQKMAIKRALVGATLQATGASGLFTQDIEDMDLGATGGGQQAGQANNTRNSGQGSQRQGNGATGGLISEAQVNYSKKLKGDKKITDEDFNRMVAEIGEGVTDIKELNKKQASELITLLNNYVAPAKSEEDPFADVGRQVDLAEGELPF